MARTLALACVLAVGAPALAQAQEPELLHLYVVSNEGFLIDQGTGDAVSGAAVCGALRYGMAPEQPVIRANNVLRIGSHPTGDGPLATVFLLSNSEGLAVGTGSDKNSGPATSDGAMVTLCTSEQGEAVYRSFYGDDPPA